MLLRDASLHNQLIIVQFKTSVLSGLDNCSKTNWVFFFVVCRGDFAFKLKITAEFQNKTHVTVLNALFNFPKYSI